MIGPVVEILLLLFLVGALVVLAIVSTLKEEKTWKN